jgi:hypothetical protein
MQKSFSELKDRSRVWDLKMSTAVTYSYKDDVYKFWTYTNQTDLLEYLNGNAVIGFNSIGFDSPLLLGENHKLDDKGNSSNGKYSWINYDIMHECKKHLYAIPETATIKEVFDTFRKNFSSNTKGMYSLNGIATATLNLKSNYICDSVELFKTKRILELIEYNLHNTRLTKQVYDFIKKYGYLLNGDYDVIQFR